MAVYDNLKTIRRLTNSSLTSIIDITNLNFKSLSEANLEFLNNIQYDETTNSFTVYSGTFDFANINDKLSLLLDGIPTFTIDSLGRAEGQEILVKVAETKRQRFTDFPDWPDQGVPGEIIYTGIQNQRPEFGEDFIGFLQDRGWVSLTGGNNGIFVQVEGSPGYPDTPPPGTGLVWVGSPGLQTATNPVTQDIYFTDENGNVFSLIEIGYDDWEVVGNDLRMIPNGDVLPNVPGANNMGTLSDPWKNMYVKTGVIFGNTPGLSIVRTLDTLGMYANDAGSGFLEFIAADDVDFSFNGQVNIGPVFKVYNDRIQYMDGSEASGYVLTSDALGNATWQPIPSYAYSAVISVTAGVPFTITHGLGTNYLVLSAVELPSEEEVDVIVNNYTLNTVDVTSSITTILRISIVTVGGNPVSVQVMSPDDKWIPALATIADGDPAVATGITNTPIDGSYVEVKVNGVEYEVGDGVTNKACYFSGDGGTTAKSFYSSNPNGKIVSGDILYWNGSVTGFELDAGWRVSYNYLTNA